MAGELQGKRIAFLFTEGAEQVELTEPLEAVRDAGAETDLISLQKGEVELWQHFDKGDKVEADHAVADVDASDYDGLVTSRKPDDLPAFCSKIVEEFAEGKHEQQVAA